ncbi:MAG: hypothetical protein EA406_03045 [Rhodospirillales bacterium]|nr:MAG: hypothetical protein EA406_03045 [Rhodospirillales bacterium]
MADWDDLHRELDAWSAAGRQATLWWRDDDATRDCPALAHLLHISARHGVPVALAVIPRGADSTLAPLLAGCPQAAALQHGYAHANHAPEGVRQEEYGPHRRREVMLAELAEGWLRIADLPQALPVLVAPWNRMDPELLPQLPEAGLHGVSTLGPREGAEPAPGVRRTNVHVDIMDWHGTGGFVGDGGALGQVLQHLRARREEAADADEPTGLMTHHGFHDEGCWRFIDAFLGATRRHPAVRWLDAREAFWPAGAIQGDPRGAPA